MKRIQWEQILALLTTAALTIAFAGCGTSSTPTEESAETTSTADQELSLLDTYVSNTVISTGSNTVIKNAEHVTYRAWFPVEAAGEYDYRFYFSNTVDSTRGEGRERYANFEKLWVPLENRYLAYYKVPEICDKIIKCE